MSKDTIYRQAAIDALAKFVPYAIDDDGTRAYTDGLTDAYNLICQLPSAEPEWIPVEQDLPKIGEYVLCETKERYFNKYHICKFVDKDEWVDRPHFDWDRNGFPHVIAWMPLPELYTER